MKLKKLAGFLVTKKENVRWLSGYTGQDPFFLLITRDKKYFFAQFSSVDQVREQSQGFNIVDITKGKDPKKIISQTFRKCKGKRIGFEDAIPYRQLSFLKRQDKNNHRHYQATKMVIDELRMIKDDEEIRCVRKACRLVDEGYWFVRRQLKVGLTEQELEWRLERYLRDRGGDERSFQFVVGFGQHSARGHHEPTSRKLKAGDPILVDYGIKYKGYASDITRTLFFGQPTAKMREVYTRVLESQQAAIKGLSLGAKVADIHKLAQGVIEKGKKYKFEHALGHGIGLEVHEAPRIASRKPQFTNFQLEPGMIFTIEPGIYLRGTGGVRIEDDVLMTKSGYQLLTKSPKELSQSIIKVKK